jgi:hypothetical protein
MVWNCAAEKKRHPCAICGKDPASIGMALPLCRPHELEWLASEERAERATARQRFIDRVRKSWTSKIEIEDFPSTSRAALDLLCEAAEIDGTALARLIGEIYGLRALCKHALDALRAHGAEYHYVTPIELLEKLEEVERST